jgi:hypothetical protein
MRKVAADLEFEEVARLRDEIRRLEEDNLGIPDPDRIAPRAGHSNEGKPGTRKMRFGRRQDVVRRPALGLSAIAPRRLDIGPDLFSAGPKILIADTRDGMSWPSHDREEKTLIRPAMFVLPERPHDYPSFWALSVMGRSGVPPRC